MRRTTSAVRSSEAAGGSCTTPTRYSLSCCGMKPAGRAHEAEHGERHQARVDRDRDGRALHGARDAALSTRRRTSANSWLKRAKKRPNTLSMPRVSASGCAPCGLSSTAASAGDSVSELNAEMTVEMAMVSANWLDRTGR